MPIRRFMTKMPEKWIACVSENSNFHFPQYEISNMGKIRHSKTLTTKNLGEHNRVTLSFNSGRKTVYLQRLIAALFNGIPEAVEIMVVENINGNKEDLRYHSGP